MRDPDLMEDIGEVTALEVSASGVHLTFAPTLCVTRDDRWGRAYECYGEHPEIGVSYSDRFVKGLQGTLSGDHIVATAKHWIGDGGTIYGTGGSSFDGTNYFIDRGNTPGGEIDRIHKPPYLPAIQEGVGSIMVSYSSIDGTKMHENHHLITKVLKEQLGFDGFVISDYDGIIEIPDASYREQVKKGVNAGIDMFMFSENWQQFIGELISLIQNGEVPMGRIDDAVRRILRIKFRTGLFEKPFTDRTHIDDGTIGSAAHRSLAREAVKKSLVLLKNKHNILPLSKTTNIFVAGSHADNIGLQCGGWTIRGQGRSGNITSGTTILQGIQAASDGQVTFNANGSGAAGHDVAVVVVGEDPYAEGKGDYPTKPLTLSSEQLSTIQNIRNARVPVVLILVSGRPLLIENELTDCDALVAVWLPGTEGAGVADVLFGDYDPTGKLPVSWPRNLSQIPINVDDANYDPLFPYNFGLSYVNPTIPFEGTPYALPGTVQAENFDRPGTESAYYDTTSGNAGGAHRSYVDVDIESFSPSEFNVGWLAAGEWLKYTVHVAESNFYDITFRLASKKKGGNFHLEMNDIDVTGSHHIGITGGWWNWVDVTISDVFLSAGEQTMKFAVEGGLFNFDAVTFTKVSGGCAQEPFGGAAIILPGIVEAEDYDTCEEGVAYHDTTPGNEGGAYRSGDVDIEASTPVGYNVGWAELGEWLEYTVNVPIARTYRLDVRYASKFSGGNYHIEFNGINVTESTHVDATGGWQNWATNTHTGIYLTAGIQTMRLVFDSAGLNIDSVSVSSESNGIPATNTFQAENYDDMRGIGVDGNYVGWFDGGDWLRYSDIDFGSGVVRFIMNAAVHTKRAWQKMELRIDGLNGAIIGIVTFQDTGTWDNFDQQSAIISGTTGIHDLYLIGAGGWGIGNIDWFTFQ
jgi:beta-glucosidase